MKENVLKGILFRPEQIEKVVPLGDGHPARNMGQSLSPDGQRALRILFRGIGKTDLQREAAMAALKYVMSGEEPRDEYRNGARGAAFKHFADCALGLILASRPIDDHDKQMRRLAEEKRLTFSGNDRMFGHRVEVRVIHDGLQWRVFVTRTRGREVDHKEFTYSDYRDARSHMEHIRLGLVKGSLAKVQVGNG